MTKIRNWLELIVSLWVFLFLLLWTSPALAASERVPLTLPLLQERLNSPLLSEGFYTIDLRNFIIDLTSENTIFREQFYQQLQTHLNRSKQPLGLDFSDSFIQGEFIASKLGLLTPLFQASLPPLFTPIEQEELKQDKRFLSQPGEQITSVTVVRGPLILNNSRFAGQADFSKVIFLQRVETTDATFTQEGNWSETRFARTADFSRTTFRREVNFSNSVFLGGAKFRQDRFLESANFTGSHFEAEVSFSQSEFVQLATFTRIQSLKDADFSQIDARDRILFSKSHFFGSLSLVNSTFEQSIAFRATRFDRSIDFRDVKLLGQVDFSNAFFSPKTTLNVSGLAFDSDRAKILGDTGVIGRVMSLSNLEDNKTVYRNLIRNFRNLEQIPDANQIEYKIERLRLQQLGKEIFEIPYQQVFQLKWMRNLFNWLFLSLLILLSGYGTNFSIVFGVGIIAIGYFGVLFWAIDRWRRRIPTPILPNRYDTICMIASVVLLTIIGLTNIFQASEEPWITLACLSVILFPIPLGLVSYLYHKGRYHDLMHSSYFLEDGSMRQLRLLIVRLPVIPNFPFFRDRYVPLIWERRWNWLNYYDFSLNNFIKLGFNDIRLRDQHLPGTISTIVWYQWSLGILYIALLLWTLSRTIPGLNLLIYLK
ncbi:hypothetical protein Ple7327_0907 [Pleurocapsa sp. PCC 7327]|uniref:pentapeptide repeat-containing protein n=1 Tax=Pleurocapsa sp. PCC 7327 TaxID=118163 RepID=UPI00029F8917|nr:pentapeptide repeat-containing protein [Pleurocapsa sp. PCC 7327]AFY76332.1 hypothetical protein Ple7327_0907 [Pleurocapsa sp. PCC 7327]